MRPLRRVILAILAVMVAIGANLAATSPASAASNTTKHYLPWAKGATYRITQDGNGTYSHNDQWGKGHIDFGIPMGTPILSSTPGTVVRATSKTTGYGNHVVVKSADGYCTVYGHLSSLSVSSGQTVKAGQQLGKSGSSGNSSGPHLRWGRVNCSTMVAVGTPNTYEYGKALYRGAYPKSQNPGASGTTKPADKNVAGTVNTKGAPLIIRSGAGTSFSRLGSLPDNAKVTVYCQRRGQTVTGTYGTSNLWNNIGNGRWVADVYVYTGSNGQLVESC